MKTHTLDEVQDKLIGTIGTPERALKRLKSHGSKTMPAM